MIGLALGLFLYNLLLAIGCLLAGPFLLGALLFGESKWRERCGGVPKPEGTSIWVHAASVGELMMIRPLLSEIKARWPEHSISLSTMTGTGRKAARASLGQDGQAFFFPLDFPWSQIRALGRLKPLMVVVCETELWPNFMWLCGLKRIPLFIVNARLSEKSFPWYRALKFLFGSLLGRAALIACQSQADALRFAALAGPGARVMMAGNLKYDSMAEPPTEDEKLGVRSELGLVPGDLVLVAGSTREGEEEILLEAWQEGQRKTKKGRRNPKLRLIMAPRHPDRFEKVAAILSKRGLEYGRRSRGDKFSETCQTILWDTLGELATAYQAGDMAFVGGSLVPVGGHNPLEPAALGLPVIFGPHMFNAAESAQRLLEAGGAVQVDSVGGLRTVIQRWIEDPVSRRSAGDKARQAVESGQGAARRTIESISNILADIDAASPRGDKGY